MKDLVSKRNLFILGMIVFAALTRIIPGMMGSNITLAPVMAMALFGGAYFTDKKAAFIAPIAAMLLSDAFLGFYNVLMMVVVYGCFALGVVIGRKAMFGKVSALRVAGSTLGASIMFFAVTNFFCWLLYYPQTMSGLAYCYTVAIPFFRTQLVRDIIWSSVMFGSFELAGRYLPKLVAEN